jgi:MFS family permease
VGVTAAFIAHAVVFSSWAAHIPRVKEHLQLSDPELGMALFGVPLGSVVATVLCHWALPRWGSHRLVPITVAGYAAVGVTVGLATSGPLLFLALTVWGMFMGALDVAMNTQAATVERLAQAPIMPRFHGMWSIGALLGAVIGVASVTAGVGLTAQLVVLGVAVLVVVVPLTWRLAPDARRPAVATDPPPPKRAYLTTPVAVLSTVVFVSFLCERTANDWSATYLNEVVGAGPSVSALSYTAYALMMVVTRFGALRMRSRVSSRRLLPALALLAAVGMCVMLATANPVAGVIGFAGLGAGVALLVPTAFSAAYSVSSAGSAISIVATAGFVGHLLGPPLIGQLAGMVGLPAALITVPVMLAIVAVVIRCTTALDAAEEFPLDPVDAAT